MPTPQRRRVCTRPFEWLEIAADTDRGIDAPVATLCCPGWLRGDPYIPFSGSVREVWNHPKALALRASVLDGSFASCNEAECPYLAQPGVRGLFGEASPVQEIEAITDPRLRAILERGERSLSEGPTILNAAYDRSCNLACPSCRSQPMGLAGAAAQRVVEFQDRLLGELRGSMTRLYVSGSGDPFASEAFRTVLGRFDPDEAPNVEVHLHSNALLWTPERWAGLGRVTERVTSAEISIDAARAETFRLNRGGSWETLLRNLGFVAQLRRRGPLRYVALSYVVQANNFRELPEFVRLMREHGFDGVRLASLRNWGTYSAAEFRERAVADPAHPRHGEFLAVLSSPELDDPGVVFGNLFRLRSNPRTRTTA